MMKDEELETQMLLSKLEFRKKFALREVQHRKYFFREKDLENKFRYGHNPRLVYGYSKFKFEI